MKTLCDLFYDRLECTSDRVAVHYDGKNYAYGQIADQSDAIAGWLAWEGVGRGERVVLLLDNSAEYVACYLGILRAGCVAVAINPDTTTRELALKLADASPAVVVVSPKAIPHLAGCLISKGSNRASGKPLVVLCSNESARGPFLGCATLEAIYRSGRSATRVMPRSEELAQLIYTSGTTGRPKGIMLSHRNIAANCASIVEYLELTEEDSVFVVLSFSYSYGNSLLFTHLAVGGRLIIAPDFVFWNRALDVMEEQQATGFSGVPSAFAMLLRNSSFRKRSFERLRYMTCAGDGLAPAVAQQIRDIVPHVRLFPMYGQTEATARLSTLFPEELNAKPGSIGRGIPGVSLRVLDPSGRPVSPGEVGEIVATGDNVMLGYWNDPDATSGVLRSEGLWTGDMAIVDEEGYIYIAGRKSDIIKSGAYRIDPKEIEDVILDIEGVAEVAVVGLPDEIWGESPTAFVVAPGASRADIERDILDHCRRHLPRHKRVRQVHFVESMPKTSSGKIKRSAVRQLCTVCPGGP